MVSVQTITTLEKTICPTMENGVKQRLNGSAKSEVQQEADIVKPAYKREIVWQNVVKFTILHSIALIGLTQMHKASLYTHLFVGVTFLMSALGVTAGAHRLWTHRSFKARFPLRLFLVLCNSVSSENSLYVWCRDHRVHHKYSETDADPHNANRGFFFSHMGWLLVRKHPDVISKGSKIDLSDLRADSLVMFQHKYYIPLSILFCFFLPSFIPYYFWGESFTVAYFYAVVRYVVVLHNTWLVNSAAHMWGYRPYDINISPAENVIVAILAAGEGFHNYHHTFPHDYSTSEWRYSFNLTTAFIDLMALFGLAYDRRSVSEETVKRRMHRTGPSSKGNLVICKDMDDIPDY